MTEDDEFEFLEKRLKRQKEEGMYRPLDANKPITLADVYSQMTESEIESRLWDEHQVKVANARLKANEKQVGGTTVDYKDLLDYDPNTGVFTWKIKTSSKAMPGYVAGWFDKDGYRCVTVLGKKLKAHRLAWWWVHGVWPEKGYLVDHINRDKSDNRISNLRIATPSQSAMNRGAQSNNKSGHKGVLKVKKYWHAQIMVAGESIGLGYYKNINDAIAAYEKAAKQLHGEFYYG